MINKLLVRIKVEVMWNYNMKIGRRKASVGQSHDCGVIFYYMNSDQFDMDECNLMKECIWKRKVGQSMCGYHKLMGVIIISHMTNTHPSLKLTKKVHDVVISPIWWHYHQVMRLLMLKSCKNTSPVVLRLTHWTRLCSLDVWFITYTHTLNINVFRIKNE